jgi:hypothetical protein
VVRGQRRLAPDQVFRPRRLGEPFEDELDGDPRAAKDGLTEHHARHSLDVLVPVHVGIVSGRLRQWTWSAEVVPTWVLLLRLQDTKDLAKPMDCFGKVIQHFGQCQQEQTTQATR